jgi:tRNA G18 (ribose-2'-O)-methylase SpoU
LFCIVLTIIAGFVQGKEIKKMKKIAYLVLHDIRSEQNVGSLFRTADASGISEIFITGYTPAPLDKFNRPAKQIAKTALGAEKSVPWEKLNFDECIKRLKKEKVFIVGIEQTKSSVNYRKVKPKYPIAFMLGNEVLGLDAKAVRACDITAEIPMKGKKESLNVSVAGGIVMFQILGI